jgi:hypothetical protein
MYGLKPVPFLFLLDFRGTTEAVLFQSDEKQTQVLRLRCASLRMTN